jgi:protein disulfide-isomerase
MKTWTHLLVVAALLVSAGSVLAEGDWLTDFEAAKKVSAESGKPILINFSGSDWCGWCIKLDNEVFAKPEFASYAKENLVLVHADFPRKKKQPKAEAAQNKALAATYGVQGFPTVLLVDATGKVIGTTGYRKGGAAAYVEHLKELGK